ncbi:MAG: hypothetical protein GC204_09670 [Chloroflexi bacterium]|nr:hypothetical protein [Chloroflexota bacterium]
MRTLPGRVLRWLRRALLWCVLIIAMFYLLNYSTLPLGDEWTQVAVLARNVQFDYVSWEINALAVKVGQTLYGLQPFMEETDRSNYVRAYMNELGHVQSIEAQINAIYTDPNVGDPLTATADLRAQRDQLRADLSERQPLAESIFEGQVAAVLVKQGFGLGGQLLPPIAMHFTQVPNLLIVSPRDKIEFDVSINLNAMTADEEDVLEKQIDKQLNVSSLIVPLGGIALYPAMILETSSIQFVAETFSHEWLHHYLFFFPLGLNYDFTGETRIINETTASLFGKEMSLLVLKQYYPELLPPPAAPVTTTPSSESSTLTPTPDPAQPPAFDFGATMNETRVTVDGLLAAGKIDEAEAYMEQQREVFVAHGYGIRKLNQAYFAFYGGYQSGSPGEGGSDPIGPAVQAIRDQSSTIFQWIQTMRGITTRDELLAAVKK